MRYSWSEHLFFSVNGLVGKNRQRDWLMVFFAKYLIFLLSIFVGFWIVTDVSYSYYRMWWFRVFFLGVAGFFGVGVNWLIGLLFPHPRPVVDFPKKVVQLIRPLGTWKTFPSDHTTVSFVLFFSIFYLGASSLVSVLVFWGALAIASGRVYVGVHYPKDVLGGVVVAFFATVFSWYVVTHFLPIFF
tara:strand:- start:374 stop:931 length:558 start_codon:yes stop_codon:yes gene_type:complete